MAGCCGVKLWGAAKNRNERCTGFAAMVGVAPLPDKDRESKTWLLEQDGPVTHEETLLVRCAYFSPLAEVVTAVAAWRDVTLAPVVGPSPHELDDLAPTFEHEQIAAAWRAKK